MCSVSRCESRGVRGCFRILGMSDKAVYSCKRHSGPSQYLFLKYKNEINPKLLSQIFDMACLWNEVFLLQAAN